jgi:ribosome-binding factor A
MSMATEVKRATRVSARLAKELAWVIARQLSDPRVSGVCVTRVEMPDDLRTAKVYLRLVGGGDASQRAAAIKALARAAGMLRKVASQRIGLRFAPELLFFYDDRQDKLERIEELLAEVQRDDRGRRGD